MKYSTILFDIDGTILDPGPSITDSARYALGQLGITENSPEALRRFVGPPLEHSFRDYYHLDEQQVQQAVAHFRHYLVHEGLHAYTIYSGIADLLATLVKNGATIGIVTSKIERIARLVIDEAGLTDYFSVFCAQEEGNPIKKEITLADALTQLNVTPDQLSQTVMIGDRMHDIEAAQANNVDSIGILHGYGTVAEFEDAGATHVVKDANELKNLLLDA